MPKFPLWIDENLQGDDPLPGLIFYSTKDNLWSREGEGGRVAKGENAESVGEKGPRFENRPSGNIETESLKYRFRGQADKNILIIVLQGEKDIYPQL